MVHESRPYSVAGLFPEPRFNGTSTFLSVNKGGHRSYTRAFDVDKQFSVSTNCYRALFVAPPVSGVSVD